MAQRLACSVISWWTWPTYISLQIAVCFLMGYFCTIGLLPLQESTQPSAASYHLGSPEAEGQKPVEPPTEGAVLRSLSSIPREIIIRTDATTAVDTNSTDRLKAATKRPRVGILIPYRNRIEQLEIFLPSISAFLAKQDIDVKFIVAEQVGEAKFNKGALLNIAFLEAFNSLPADYFDCVVIHDIDLIPIIAENKYDCRMQQLLVGAVQLSTAIEKYDWGLPLNGPGGVNLIKTPVFRRANGYSNRFFGWGGEDNDFDRRMRAVGVNMVKSNTSIGRYRNTKVAHRRSGVSVDRCTILHYTKQSGKVEGLPTVRYRTLESKSTELYTYVKLDLWNMEDPEYFDIWKKEGHPDC